MSGTGEGEPAGGSEGADLFAHIRAGCARVMDRARFVRLAPERVASVAERCARDSAEPPRYDTRHHHRGAPGSTLAYVLTLDTINFGSGTFPALRKPRGLSGYFTLATRLKARFDDRGPWSAAELAEMDTETLAVVLGQDSRSPAVVELLARFAEALRDLGGLLLERYHARYEGLIEAAGGRAERLVRELARMPLYRDVARYEDFEVPFYKRAQIAAADLALAFEGRGAGRFEDLSLLTAFADNLVPHVLRLDGVLEYAPSLLGRIEAGEPIPAGSPEEIEIRAGAVHGVEQIVDAARRLGVSLTAPQVDSQLWHRGQAPAMKAYPRHRTRSSFY